MTAQTPSRIRPSPFPIAAFLEAVGAPALIVESGHDGECRVVAGNRRWTDAVGLAGAVPAGSPLDRALPSPASAAFLGDIASAARGRTTERIDDLHLPVGERRWRIVLAPLPAEAGGDARVMLTVTDLTAARQVEQVARAHDRRFQAVVAQLPVGVSLKDRDGRYILINPQQSAWFGISVTAAAGRRPTEILPYENGVRAERRDRDALAGRTTRAELRTPIADGSMRDFLLVSFPVLDDGDVIGACTLMIDNTSLKNVERALQLSEERFRDFAETAADWLWETDRDQRFTYISGGRLLTDRRSVLGHTRREVIEHLGGDPAVTERIARLMARGRRIRDLVYQARGPDGEPVFVRLTGKPVFDAAGDLVGYRGTNADVTAQHRTAAAMMEAKEHADLANRSKSEFLANMSHELRTPLNAIIGFSESLDAGLFGPLEPRQREYIRDIRSSGAHLLAIINDILDVAKIEAGKATLDEGDVHVAELIEATLRLIRPRADEQGLRLTVDVPADLPTLHADEQRMKQVLLNLLSNAVKFTEPPGSVSVEVSVDAEGLALVVRDTGIGIAARDMPKVLAPFGQVDGRLTRRHAGTGLGLPLSKALVELHGGTLRLASTPGKGTSVTVRLPAARLGGGA